MAKTANRQFKYDALAYSQRTGSGSPSFLLFHAPAAEILDWAAVDRLEPDSTMGAQRPLKKLKVTKVVRFFESDKRNTVPTAIVVSLDENSVTFEGEPDGRGSGRHHHRSGGQEGEEEECHGEEEGLIRRRRRRRRLRQWRVVAAFPPASDKNAGSRRRCRSQASHRSAATCYGCFPSSLRPGHAPRFRRRSDRTAASRCRCSVR
jgi:hypothetical protein